MLNNITVKGETIDDIYEKWLDIFFSNLNESKSRDGEVASEVINAVTILNNPINNILHSNIRNISIKYAVGEFIWYLSGNNNLCEIQKFTKNWDRMSDDGKTVNSNYGYCVQKKYGFDQLKYVYELLSENPESRQAIIHIKEPSNKKSKDVNCTVALQFFIRDKKLYMTTYMRSNDIWLGFPYDVFQFCNLQILLSMMLGIELGNYTHIAGSLHLYKRDYEKMIERMVE